MKRHFTTIVGGRPDDRLPISDIPRNLEVLLKKARVDGDFRQILLDDSITAAGSIGLNLTTTEKAMLASTSPRILGRLAARTFVPRHHESIFRTCNTAAMLALVMAATMIHPVDAQGGVETAEMDEEEVRRMEIDQKMREIQLALEGIKADQGQYLTTEEWYTTKKNPMKEYVPNQGFVDNEHFRYRYMGIEADGVVIGYRLESNNGEATCPIDTEDHLFVGPDPLTILFPSQNLHISQSNPDHFLFRASHTAGQSEVKWYLDGFIQGKTVDEHNLDVSYLSIDRHKLLVVDQEGYFDILWFNVDE